MKRADVTYGQMDRVLRALGFSCTPSKKEPPGRFYEHKESGAKIVLPTFPDNARVYEHHLLTVRITLDNFGIADPTTFDAKLQKAG